MNVQLDRKEGSLEVELPTWQETFHNPTTTPTNAEFRIDTLGKPNDAYALHYVGRVVRVSREMPDRKTPAPKRNVK